MFSIHSEEFVEYGVRGQCGVVLHLDSKNEIINTQHHLLYNFRVDTGIL